MCSIESVRFFSPLLFEDRFVPLEGSSVSLGNGPALVADVATGVNRAQWVQCGGSSPASLYAGFQVLPGSGELYRSAGPSWNGTPSPTSMLPSPNPMPSLSNTQVIPGKQQPQEGASFSSGWQDHSPSPQIPSIPTFKLALEWPFRVNSLSQSLFPEEPLAFGNVLGWCLSRNEASPSTELGSFRDYQYFILATTATLRLR